MHYWKAELVDILMSNEPKGFTHYLYWPEKRYVIWLTNNIDRSYGLLLEQIELYKSRFKIITLGGRQDPKRSKFVVDIGTATNDLVEAKKRCVLYKQDCIRDSVNWIELRP